jgi:polyisoprenyl-phosphate glycosyltransferase
MPSLRFPKASTMTEIQNEELSLIIPVYRNAENIDSLVAALCELNTELHEQLTVTFVIDGSPDASGAKLVERQPRMPFASRILFHSRNFGSFTAIRTGLEFARGRFFAVMAADLQEPPELVKEMFARLSADEADLVLGVRANRDDGIMRDFFSWAFWGFYRKLVIPEFPRGGIDIFACNGVVRDSVLAFREPNSSLIAQLFWLGFRRSFVHYQRRKRTEGRSAWRFSTRMRYMMDSIFSFSDLPILMALWIGVIGLLASLIFGFFLLYSHFLGRIDVPGYVTLAMLITLFGSMGLMMQGVLGSYLWRTFENTKQRPLRLISRTSEHDPASSCGRAAADNDAQQLGLERSL